MHLCWWRMLLKVVRHSFRQWLAFDSRLMFSWIPFNLWVRDRAVQEGGMLPLRGWPRPGPPPSPTPSQSLIPRCVKNYKLQSPNGLSSTPSTEWSCPLWSLRSTNTTTGDKLEFKVTGLCSERRTAWTESWGYQAQRQVARGARRSISLRPDSSVGRRCRISFCHWQILTT